MDASITIHRLALCESKAVGAGTRLWAFSHVQEGAQVGTDCNIGEQVFVESGAVIGNRCTIKNGVAIWTGVTLADGVFVGPNVTFTNVMTPRAFLKKPSTEFLRTSVGEGATLGANATLLCGLSIGAFSLIGAGSVVCEDVAPHALVVGNPARPIGRVCFCATRLDNNDTCPQCGLRLSANSLAQVQNLWTNRRKGGASPELDLSQ